MQTAEIKIYIFEDIVKLLSHLFLVHGRQKSGTRTYILYIFSLGILYIFEHIDGLDND